MTRSDDGDPRQQVRAELAPEQLEQEFEDKRDTAQGQSGTRGRSTNRRPRALPSTRKVNRRRRWQATARTARTAIRACLRLATRAFPASFFVVIKVHKETAPASAGKGTAATSP